MSESPAAEPGPNTPAPPSPTRWQWGRRWLKRLVLLMVAGSICLSLARLGEREWDRVRSENELTRALASAERTDPDWTWERLNAARPRPPAGKNSAELIPQIKKR